MAIHGELNGVTGTKCPMCRNSVELSVCKSAAGYYLGYWCCGPISRESGYFPSRETAQTALVDLQQGGHSMLRDTEFKPSDFDIEEF